MIKYIYVLAFGIGLYLIYLFTKGKNVINLDTSNATISNEQAGIYASQLHTAMEDFGTNEDVIISIFSLISSEDFKLIFKHFGLKPYLWLGNAPSFLAMPIDLVEWLNKEVGDIANVKQIINEAGFVY